jgi:hypothetical protein
MRRREAAMSVAFRRRRIKIQTLGWPPAGCRPAIAGP